MKKTILLGFLFLAACAQSLDPASQDVAKNVVADVPCAASFKTTVWDNTKEYLIQQKAVPSVSQLKEHISTEIKSLKVQHPETSDVALRNLENHLHELFETILTESAAGEDVRTPEQLLVLLSAIDVGDHTTSFRSYMADKTEKIFQKVQQDAEAINIACTRTPGTGDGSDDGLSASPAGSFDNYLKQITDAGGSAAVAGERWALATAYQSCNTLNLPAMTKTTPGVSGISIVGTHPDGVGSKRMISSLSEVQRTHYYIKDERSYASSCFNVRNTPLIYDYGGKAYATTAATSPIDLFKNAGDGTSVLGIDCSGFVFTAYATAGLKMNATRALKAIDGSAWGSSTYVEPQKNGLSCLNKITVTATSDIKPGDIVAIYGHVFLIDSVGVDPFGLDKTSTVADCSKLNAKDFDFVIAQSSNSKSGIGINRYQIRDYAVEKGGTIQDGLQKYAYYSCLARYNKTTYTPSLGNLSVVRHKGTPECKAPRVQMSREECIKDCSF